MRLNLYFQFLFLIGALTPCFSATTFLFSFEGAATFTDGFGNQRSVKTDEPDLLSLSLNEGFDESELSLGDIESLMLTTTIIFTDEFDVNFFDGPVIDLTDVTEFEATLDNGVFTEFIFTANTVSIITFVDGTQGEIPLRFSVDSNFEGRLESAISGLFETELSGPFVQIPEPSSAVMMLIGGFFFLRRMRRI